MGFYVTGDIVNTVTNDNTVDIADTGDIRDIVEFGCFQHGKARNTLSRSGLDFYDFDLTLASPCMRVSIFSYPGGKFSNLTLPCSWRVRVSLCLEIVREQL